MANIIWATTTEKWGFGPSWLAEGNVWVSGMFCELLDQITLLCLKMMMIKCSSWYVQKDSVRNQREHLILLLANIHIRLIPKPEPQNKVCFLYLFALWIFWNSRTLHLFTAKHTHHLISNCTCSIHFEYEYCDILATNTLLEMNFLLHVSLQDIQSDPKRNFYYKLSHLSVHELFSVSGRLS